MTDEHAASRPDRSKAIAVEAGLELLKTEGRTAAAAFMEDAGVPLAVIARVLNEPARRRAMTLPAAHDVD
ncbi:hypothetical protein ASF61_11160 [Duganella sp. Leaf126]|uniref:hypothetical protein n=1 Tax=Duganella sp. Leaf126 TaxID=1736266 RepID=UPI0006FE5DCA|nr:hypothetical protein [Duganella sp. Leaf126]KQQ33618.1 hypothetical protein ASF61_11160 [Duganella sp. Leaf126]